MHTCCELEVGRPAANALTQVPLIEPSFVSNWKLAHMAGCYGSRDGEKRRRPLITRDEVRRMAANFAKLPELQRRRTEFANCPIGKFHSQLNAKLY